MTHSAELPQTESNTPERRIGARNPAQCAESDAAKWREWIDANAHYCPHCPTEQQEAVIIVSELESFLGTLIDGTGAHDAAG